MPHPIDHEALGDHLDGVRRLVRTLVRDQHLVDDVVQDTMVAALENRTQVRGLRAWLAGVARNVARHSVRSEGRRARHEQAVPARATAPATADVIARAAEQRRVLDALLGMEEPYRSAVLLRFIEDLPPRHIAKRLGLPVETVRTHVRRGLERLRLQLAEAHHGDRAELRAALALAASEPLGAAHARAVALARASGLMLLLVALSAGVFFLLSDPAPDAPPTYLTEQDGGATEPSGLPAVEPATAGSPAATSDPASAALPPPRPVPGVAGAGAEPDAGPEPAVGPGPAVRPPLVQPIEPVPSGTPRIAVEDDGGKAPPGPKPPGQGPGRRDPAAGGAPQEAETEGRQADGQGSKEEGEFYSGETSFSAKQVGGAIDKGIAWLTKRQSADGSWGALQFNADYQGGQQAAEGMPAGPTALALYALLKCKVPLRHDSVRRGFAWLQKHHAEPASSYEVSMLLLAVTATADDAKMLTTAQKRVARPKLTGRYRTWARKLVDALVEKREARGWRYNVRRGAATPGGPEDLSSTQLAALALFSAHRLGIKVKPAVWEDVLVFSLAQQEDDGPEVVYADPIDRTRERRARARGFAYIRGSEKPDEAGARGGMTACGIANLEMARFVLSDGGSRRSAWSERDDAERVQQAIYDGLAWLDANWSPFDDPHAQNMNVYPLYWVYALERAMDLLALERIGTHRWYSEMGQELLNRQLPTGHWATRGTARGHDVLDTSFALLFLKRATKNIIPFGAVTGGALEPADRR